MSRTSRMPVRWPWSELRTALRAAGYRTRTDQIEVLGITTRTLERWQAAGVPDTAADRAALDIGSHPQCVWIDWGLGAPSVSVSDPSADTEAA